MSIWDMNKAVDTAGLVDNMVGIGAALRDRKAIDKAQKEFREGYAKALAAAKNTGVMPEQYQQMMPIDQVSRQVGVKVVALRELGKVNPGHPLVASAQVRENIAIQTLVNYNRADRPEDADLNAYAPSDQAAQKIYDFTLGR